VNELILAVDTTHEHGSLALVRAGETLGEVLLHGPEGFAHILYDHLARLLERHGVNVCDVDCFAAASGPGSFTGVRIGLACVKGLAEACAKPLVAVSNLEATARFGGGRLRAVVIDARRGEVYGAVYDAAGLAVVPETVGKFEPWLATLPEGELEFVTMDYAPALGGTRFENARVTTAPRAVAGAVAAIALERLREGRACDPAAADANYVRRSDAELLWKDR
jgi:tRNA threonylcarbamoyladenosine biosynthesis protein TsaB